MGEFSLQTISTGQLSPRPKKFMERKMRNLGFFILFILLIGEVVLGEESSSCMCGVNRVPCAKSLTSSDCPNGRVIAKRDCPCCFVCAKQLTEECNNEDLLCDSDYGLECGSDKRCKAKTPCSDDTICSSDLMCFGGACAMPCKVTPDVCKEANMTNGICVSRNHRALCTCPPGTSLDKEKGCITVKITIPETVDEDKKCEMEGRQLKWGETTYAEKCQKSCSCESIGEMYCENVKKPPVCKSGFIPMSNITGEMTDTCKILIGNDSLFDGCCVPEQCQVIKSQDHNGSDDENEKVSRDFKLTESHNNLGEDDKSKLKIESTKDLDDGSSSASSNNAALKLKGDEGTNMQVIVLKRTDQSATIKLPTIEKEAVLSIALSKKLIQNPGSFEVWKEHKIPPGLPQITLSTLLPSTSYTLKYSVEGKEYPTVQFITDEPTPPKESIETLSSSESKSSEDSTEMMTPMKGESSEVPTTLSTPEEIEKEAETTIHPVSSVGCLYNGTSYETGEIFFQGCDERCECLKGGEVKCSERCSIPLFKKGAFSHDKMCFEEPSGIDDCCVLIACARGSPHGRSEESGRDIVAIVPQPCDSVKCGLNAHCLGPAAGFLNSEEEQQTNQTLCVCDEGHLGDPYDEVHGCQSSVTPTNATEVVSSPADPTPTTSSSTSTTTVKADGCVFKNKTYEFGEEHLDDCSYRCRCETSGEFLCVPRCNYRRDEEKEIPAGCEIQKDPSDLECCEMLVCHGEPLKTGTKKDAPTVPTDGCSYKNKTYAKAQKFYDGCEQQCMCFSNGDVTCQPRCPPAASNSTSDDCVTLPDPADECCTVSVCGNSTLSDVMKSEDSETTLTTEAPAIIGEGRSSITAKPEKKPFSIRISMIHPVNETTVFVAVRIRDADLTTLANEMVTIEYSKGDDADWKNVTTKVSSAIKTGRAEITVPVMNLSSKVEYHFKAKIGEAESNKAAGFTKLESLGSLEDGEFVSSEFSNADTDGESQEEMDGVTTEDDSSAASSEKLACMHKGKKYDYGEEFFDKCDAYCTCRRGGKMKCVEIDCPVDGLDLLDDTCVKWEPDPKFKKEAPNCCPQMRCVQHSSCILDDGVVIRNFDEVPQKITGCDKRCYCEFGNITCQQVCPPMAEHSPSNLPCPREFAVVVTMPENECCYQWSCRMPQIPPHHLNNLTNPKGPNKLNTTAQTKLPNSNKTTTVNRLSVGPKPNAPTIPHGQGQIVPPTLVHGADKLNPHQLQELLHHLTTLGEGPAPDQSAEDLPPNAGTFVQVQTPEQVRELERELGARLVDRGEDGTYILMIPNAGIDDDQNYSDHLEHGHGDGSGHGGPPFSHARPPPGFAGPGGHQFPFDLSPFQVQRPPVHGMPQDRNKVSNIVVHPLNESTLQIDFTVAQIFVGLQGHVEVMYTNEFEHKPNPAQWERKVFQQAEDLIDNTHLQLFLTNLKQDTVYHIQIKVVLVQSEMGAFSDIIRTRTPPIAVPKPTLPPEIVVDPEIQLMTVSSNSVKLHWRKFTDVEKNFVDGVQIAYKDNDDKVYSTTTLIHRSLSEFELENLQPDKEYEIKLLFIPFDSNQTTVLKSDKPIFVRTTPAEDEYSFNIAISHGKITQTTAEIKVEGIPHPEDKYVNIYQVIYMSGAQKQQKEYFKVPQRETSKQATLSDLRPATNYTLWLEAFLSNGKKKRSNVITIQTKAGALPRPEMSGQENYPQNLELPGQTPQAPSYYGALVGVSLVAAMSIIAVLALLMILIRKQSYAKAPINDRKSESSYDNPSFKSYDVESNGHMKPSEL